ncbi:replication-relaxation family protein [Leucobacter chromiireducens]|uniref:replication-relaxation family protein n=1 Tax=Leucobacter chromiireducens TaxID=283877 RepID=UPI000F6424DE|nr:replication-relaxation family protein [Leucobacter chromiireducens]
MTALLDHPIYQELLAHLLELRFATTGQLARLTREHYGSAQSARRQTMRHLSKLEQHGQLLRLERRVGGWQRGSAQSIWALTTTGYRQVAGQARTRQRPNLISTTFLEHLLAIAETRIIAYETVQRIPSAELRVKTEPVRWRNYLGPHGERLTLRPDLLMSVTTPEYLDRYFIEVDRATENPARVIAKCWQYVRYRRSGAEQQASGAFPAVLWIVPTTKRRTQLRAHLVAAELPQSMFAVLTLDELSGIIRDGPPLTKQNNTRKENTPYET